MIVYLFQPTPLFTKIEESTAHLLKERFAGKRTFSTSVVKEAAPATSMATDKAELDKQVCTVYFHCPSIYI